MIDKNILQDLYDNRLLTTRQISKLFAVDKSTICNWLKKYNIIRRSSNQKYIDNSTIRLSKLEFDFLVGTLLGDGHISVLKSGRLARFSASHSIKQLDYVNYKADLLKKLNPKIKHNNILSNNKTYKVVNISTIGTTDLLRMHDLFYINKKKVVSDKLIHYLKSPISLAVWVMDDGTLFHNSLTICTDSFSYNEHLILKEILKNNFNLNAKIIKYGKYYRLRFSVSETVKLSSLIEPFMIEKMNYKILVSQPAIVGNL